MIVAVLLQGERGFRGPPGPPGPPSLGVEGVPTTLNVPGPPVLTQFLKSSTEIVLFSCINKSLLINVCLYLKNGLCYFLNVFCFLFLKGDKGVQGQKGDKVSSLLPNLEVYDLHFCAHRLLYLYISLSFYF